MKVQYDGRKNAELEKNAKKGDKVVVVFGGKIWTRVRRATIISVNKKSFRVSVDGTNDKVTVPNQGQVSYQPWNCIMPLTAITEE